jgi:hypothetical protein
MHIGNNDTNGSSLQADEVDSLAVEARLLRQLASHLEGERPALLARLENNSNSLAECRRQSDLVANRLADLRSAAPTLP